MKFIIKKDIDYILKLKTTITLLYFITILIFAMLSKFFIMAPENEIREISFGLNFILDEINFLKLVFFVLNVSFYSYIAILLYKKDLEENFENIFLRITKNKWIMMKLISTITISTTFITLLYLFVTIFHGFPLNIVLYINTIFFVSIIVLIALNLISKKSIISLVAILITLLNYEAIIEISTIKLLVAVIILTLTLYSKKGANYENRN